MSKHSIKTYNSDLITDPTDPFHKDNLPISEYDTRSSIWEKYTLVLDKFYDIPFESATTDEVEETTRELISFSYILVRKMIEIYYQDGYNDGQNGNPVIDFEDDLPLFL